MKQHNKLSKEKVSQQRNLVEIINEELVTDENLTRCIEHKVDFLKAISDSHNSWASVCSDSQIGSDDSENNSCYDETDAYVEEDVEDVAFKS